MWRPLPRSAGAPTPALPRLPAGRGALGDVAAPRLSPQRPGAECRAAAHLRPRDAARRPARPPLESECRAAATAPEAGLRSGPPPPEPASPRRAARHSHFGGGDGEGPRVGGLVLQASETEEMGGAAVTSRAGAGPEPAMRSQPPRARRKWAGREPGWAPHRL